MNETTDEDMDKFWETAGRIVFGEDAKWAKYIPMESTMADQSKITLGPDGHEWAKTLAGYDFVDTMISRADDKINLMWFGWALREAFVAGSEWQERR